MSDIETCLSLKSKHQDRDRESFIFIFEKFNRLLYAFAFHYLKSGDEAEDAVQFTFMKLWEQYHDLDSTTNVKSLLFAIIKNYILNEIRHNTIVLEKHYEIRQIEDEADDSILDRIERDDLKQHLKKAINHLPTQKRMICMLKIEKGLSNEEIAEAMNLSVATVKSHYTKAIKMIRSEMGTLIVLWYIYFCFNN